MRRSRSPARTAHCISTVLLIATSIGLGGCFPLEGGENIADQYGEAAGFCGFLQDCGSHSERDERSSSAASEPEPDPDTSSEPESPTDPT
jgi:hypothetical protein